LFFGGNFPFFSAFGFRGAAEGGAAAAGAAAAGVASTAAVFSADSFFAAGFFFSVTFFSATFSSAGSFAFANFRDPPLNCTVFCALLESLIPKTRP